MNMKHCQFENTYNDLKDVFDRLIDSDIETLEKEVNQYEKRYIRKLIKLCIQIAENFEDEL